MSEKIQDYGPKMIPRYWVGSQGYMTKAEAIKAGGVMPEKRKGKTTPDQRWADDSIQFPRLLAELNAVGLDAEQMKMLAESMDLEWGQIDEIFDRALTAWEKQKSKV